MDKSKWEYKKWENVLDIINGRDYKSVVDPNGIYPICGSGGIMGHANSYLCPENSVIIGRKGNINHPIFMNEKYWNVDTAFGLVAKEGILLPKFLFYFCDWYDFEKHNKAVTIPSLTKRDLLKIQIQIPSITDQQRIVSELDQLNELISLKQEQLKEYDALAQSLFYETFGDPFVNPFSSPFAAMEEACTLVTDGTHNPPKFKEEGIPFILVANIKDNEILYDTKKFISEADYDALWKSTPIEKGDLLYTCVGSFGNPAIVESDKKFMFQRHIALLKIKRELLSPKYMLYFLNTQYAKAQADIAAKGIAQRTVTLTNLKKMKVMLPPLSLQHSFATKVRAIEAQKDLLKQSIGELQTLLASRMQEYFA